MSDKKNVLTVKQNKLWGLLNDASKLAVLDLLMEEGFKGDVRLIGVVKGDATVIQVENSQNLTLELPINILDVLNN